MGMQLPSIRPQALRAHMARRGLSQLELARRAALSDSTISLALQGQPISATSIKKILDALLDTPVHPLAAELLGECEGAVA